MVATELIGRGDVPSWADVEGQLTVEQVLEELNLRALSVAPCLTDAAPEQRRLAMVILRGAAMRWHGRITGAAREMTHVVSGPFQAVMQPADPAPRESGLLWPSEIAQLQQVCLGGVVGHSGRASTRWLL